jgi:hypothetical protein
LKSISKFRVLLQEVSASHVVLFWFAEENEFEGKYRLFQVKSQWEWPENVANRVICVTKSLEDEAKFL